MSEGGRILGRNSYDSKPAFLTDILQICPLLAVLCCMSCGAAFLLAPVFSTARRHSVESSKTGLWNCGWGWLQGWTKLRGRWKGDSKLEQRENDKSWRHLEFSSGSVGEKQWKSFAFGGHGSFGSERAQRHEVTSRIPDRIWIDCFDRCSALHIGSVVSSTVMCASLSSFSHLAYFIIYCPWSNRALSLDGNCRHWTIED